MKMNRWLLASSILLALSGALAQEGNTNEAAASDTEMRGGYSVLDGDGDGALNPGEFGTGLHDMVAGEDLVISEEEYSAFVERVQVEEAPTDFAGADANNDGALSADQEFIPAVATKLFQKWDTDGDNSLSSDEYRGAWFGLVDADGNGTVTAEEYEPYADWFGADFATLAGGGGEDGVAGGGAGETAEGENAEGETAEGDATEGENAEGDTTEGDTTEGDTAEGDATEGGTTDAEGDAGAGTGTPEGVTMEEFMQGW